VVTIFYEKNKKKLVIMGGSKVKTLLENICLDILHTFDCYSANTRDDKK